MATYLDGIVAHHRARLAADDRSIGDVAAALAGAPAARPFLDALSGGRATSGSAGLAVIAEVKRRSPSKGDLAPGLDPAALARAYAAGGAACLSVLTDGPHFGGSPADLAAARDAASLPVLRKDFTVGEIDLYDARAMGADAVLLIVAALDDDELTRFVSLAERLGLAALVEVHDEDELDRALGAGARLVGVNQRDLRTFEVDTDLAALLRARIPDEIVSVAESGITDAADVRRLAAAGFDAILVGEALVTAADPTAALLELRGLDEVSGDVEVSGTVA